MTEFPLAPETPVERVLLRELIRRINNEFASILSAVSRVAARSGNQAVKVALGHIIEQLSHYAEVHHALQMPGHDGYIDAAAYLDHLCLSISRSRIDGENRMRPGSPAAASRSRTRGWRTATGPIPVITSRSGR